MNITLTNDPVTTNQHPNVDIEFGDNGNAFVALTLYINDVSGVKYALVHDEQYSGSVTKSLPLDKGSYPCTFVIQAHRNGALGSVYDSFLKISSNGVATAKGSIATGNYEAGHTYFTLNVI